MDNAFGFCTALRSFFFPPSVEFFQSNTFRYEHWLVCVSPYISAHLLTHSHTHTRTRAHLHLHSADKRILIAVSLRRLLALTCTPTRNTRTHAYSNTPLESVMFSVADSRLAEIPFDAFRLFEVDCRNLFYRLFALRCWVFSFPLFCLYESINFLVSVSVSLVFVFVSLFRLASSTPYSLFVCMCVCVCMYVCVCVCVCV
jgi:hypothetical protein